MYIIVTNNTTDDWLLMNPRAIMWSCTLHVIVGPLLGLGCLAWKLLNMRQIKRKWMNEWKLISNADTFIQGTKVLKWFHEYENDVNYMLSPNLKLIEQWWNMLEWHVGYHPPPSSSKCQMREYLWKFDVRPFSRDPEMWRIYSEDY